MDESQSYGRTFVPVGKCGHLERKQAFIELDNVGGLRLLFGLKKKEQRWSYIILEFHGPTEQDKANPLLPTPKPKQWRPKKAWIVVVNNMNSTDL